MNHEQRAPEMPDREPENNPQAKGSRKILSILTIISALTLILILQTVLTPFIFACIIATLTWPLRDKLLKITKGRASLTSGILILGMILLIGAPVTGILLLAFSQAQDFVSEFNPERAHNWFLLQGDRLDHLHLANQLGFTSENLLLKLKEGMSSIAGWSMSLAVGVGSNVLHTLVMLGITLMSLFYLYVSGDAFVLRVKSIIPLPDSQVTELLDVFRRTSKAIFKGNFVIGATQGLMTGLLFWGTGLPSPAFFGVAAAFASLIPAVGTGLIWGPAVIYLAISDELAHALIVLCIGTGIISTIDSIMRPALVGRDAGMHDLLVFLTTIGGISFFGPIGVLFGPLVGAGVLAILRLYEESRKPTASESA